MPQFFVKTAHMHDNECVIEGDDYYHLRRVRRAKNGDKIRLRLEDGTLCIGRITGINSVSIKAEIIERIPNQRTVIKFNLFAAVLKGKMFDFVIQKAVEIGVSRIVPVITERTVPVIEDNSKKNSRWKKIMTSASKQCMRTDFPVMEDITSFREAVSAEEHGLRMIAHPGKGSMNIRELLEQNTEKNVSVLIGPEGGFTEKEIGFAVQNNWKQIAFGFTSLRAETASIVLPAILMYELGIKSRG